MTTPSNAIFMQGVNPNAETTYFDFFKNIDAAYIRECLNSGCKVYLNAGVTITLLALGDFKFTDEQHSVLLESFTREYEDFEPICDCLDISYDLWVTFSELLEYSCYADTCLQLKPINK